MNRPLPALPAPPPLSWPYRLVLVFLMPLWLPVLGIVIAYGILFAPDPVETEPAVPDEDDGLPDDYVPPFVPPQPNTSPTRWRKRPLEPNSPELAEPASALVADAVPANRPRAEQLRAETSCWTTSFPAG